MTTKTMTVVCALLLGAMLLVASGCQDPYYGLKDYQIKNLKAWEGEGIDIVKKKDTSTACGLGFVLGAGSFYTGEIGWGVLDLVTWPLSMAWDPILATRNANRINYQATEDVALGKTKISVRARLPRGAVSCDIRLVRVSDGTVMCGSSADAPGGDLMKMCDSLAEAIKKRSDKIQGSAVAVVSLKDRRGTPQGRALADEVGDKLTNSLANLGWFNVKERLDLTSIINERDLEDAKIINNAEVKKRLAGTDYVLLGGVSAVK